MKCPNCHRRISREVDKGLAYDRKLQKWFCCRTCEWLYNQRRERNRLKAIAEKKQKQLGVYFLESG